jgi:ketopantoate hydroxymethyltransferase
MKRAFGEYLEEVQTRQFPGKEHSVEMNDEEWESFLKLEHGL